MTDRPDTLWDPVLPWESAEEHAARLAEGAMLDAAYDATEYADGDTLSRIAWLYTQPLSEARTHAVASLRRQLTRNERSTLRRWVANVDVVRLTRVAAARHHFPITLTPAETLQVAA